MNETEMNLMLSFLAKLRDERNYSSHTLKSYSRDLKSLVAYCEAQDIRQWTDINDEDIPKVRRVLRAAALTYLAGSLSSLLNLWRWIAILRR